MPFEGYASGEAPLKPRIWYHRVMIHHKHSPILFALELSMGRGSVRVRLKSFSVNDKGLSLLDMGLGLVKMAEVHCLRKDPGVVA